MRMRQLSSHIRSSLWFVPVVCVLAGAALSFGTIWLDSAFDYKLVPEWLSGGPDAALAILSTVAASMVSLAALVLTITMVVVQLAMGQFSPRIVQTILRDKPSQIAIGLFVATFVHAMLALREVQLGGEGSVPGLAILVAYLLVVISVVVLVLYVHHIGRSLRVSALIELVGNDTRTLLDKVYSGRLDPVAADDNVVAAPLSGVVTAIGRDDLVAIAEESGCVLEMVPALGAFVPAGAPLFRVSGNATRLDAERVSACVLLGLERTLDEDVAYGMRMLVDMAERALADSPFLDPTTAVQAIDRLHDCLRQLARRVFPDGLYRDADGSGATHRARHGLGRLREPRLRRDPDGRRTIAAGDAPAHGGARRPRNRRATRASARVAPSTRPVAGGRGGDSRRRTRCRLRARGRPSRHRCQRRSDIRDTAVISRGGPIEVAAQTGM